MGKNKTSSTQTTTTSLPQNQQTNVDALLQGALDYYNSGGRVFYPGDLVADFDPAQTAGQEAMLAFAGGAGQDFVNQAMESNSFFMDPNNIFKPENIPGFQSVIDSIVNNTTRGLTEGVLPYVRGGATSSGQYGGSAMGIGEALAADRTTENIADTIGQVNLGAYGMGLDSFNQAMARAPQIFGLGAMPSQLMMDVGGMRQTQAQNEIQADVARHEFEQNEPMAQLDFLRNMTGTYGQYGGTQRTDATQTTKTSPVNAVLGGALAAASLWNPMTSMFAGLKPLAGTGGGIGSLFGAKTPSQLMGTNNPLEFFTAPMAGGF